LKLYTLAGNHQFHYLTGKHGMFNISVDVMNFLRSLLNFSTEVPSAVAFILMQKFYYNMLFFCKHHD